MASIKNNLILILSLFPLIPSAQVLDPDLLSQLSPEQIVAARDIVDAQKVNGLVSEDLLPINESLVENEQQINSNFSSKKFGYDFFSTMPTSLSALGDLPLPNDYKISLKDQFRIILSGSRDQIFNLNVNLDGTILFPELGSVYVAGLTFKEVKDKLSNMVDQSYIGVNIDISLQNLSAKKVTIVGAVNIPGTYLINPFSTITGALAYSGGISEIGSLRNIKLIRNNGKVFSFDLYQLLINGDRSNDLTIEAGDTILIGAAKQFIEIEGAVNRPGTYEVLEGEGLNDIVNFALGFTSTANKSNIAISYLDLNSASVITKTNTDLDHNLKNVLVVSVFNYRNEDNFSVSVVGAVEEPGFYDLERFDNLGDLIEGLKFVDVYPWLAVLEQFDDDNLIKSTLLFSLNDKTTYESIKLFPNSRIYFANIDERSFDVEPTALNRINDYSLAINHKEETFSLPVIGKYAVKSFTDLLGLDMSDVESEITYISPLDSTIIVGDYKKMNLISKKFQNITFRSPINNLIRVNVSGAVDFPGNYTLQSDSTLEDLYNMVGNFKREAFLDGIILTRNSVRERQLKAIENSEAALNKTSLIAAQQGESVGDISILSSLAKSIEPENLGRVAGDFSPLSSSNDETILFDGDTIIIPKKSNVVNVIGEVLNPIAFEYTSQISIKSAIEKAGGYQTYADKKRVYVIKANGLVENFSKNVFVGNSKLEPGDTIVVPRKIYTNTVFLRSLAPITQILSDLSFSAAAIENLSNN